MADVLERHFLGIVKNEFPGNVEIHVRRESDDICIYLDWELGNDPARPSKRSKTIKVCISKEAIKDYVAGNEQLRKKADDRLRRVIAEQLRLFDPDHGVPAHNSVPVEQWTISTNILNG